MKYDAKAFGKYPDVMNKEWYYKVCRVSKKTALYLLQSGLIPSKCTGNAIDFERGTVTVKHTVTSTELDGKRILVQSDKAKTNSSLRTMPQADHFGSRWDRIAEKG